MLNYIGIHFTSPELGERESGSLSISDSLHQSKSDNSSRLVSRNLIGRESAKCSDSQKLRNSFGVSFHLAQLGKMICANFLLAFLHLLQRFPPEPSYQFIFATDFFAQNLIVYSFCVAIRSRRLNITRDLCALSSTFILTLRLIATLEAVSHIEPEIFQAQQWKI